MAQWSKLFWKVRITESSALLVMQRRQRWAGTSRFLNERQTNEQTANERTKWTVARVYGKYILSHVWYARIASNPSQAIRVCLLKAQNLLLFLYRARSWPVWESVLWRRTWAMRNHWQKQWMVPMQSSQSRTSGNLASATMKLTFASTGSSKLQE